ncbi:MAG: hypothetical protein ACRDJW_22835 [Thermomicrobiales bacterium]
MQPADIQVDLPNTVSVSTRGTWGAAIVSDPDRAGGVAQEQTSRGRAPLPLAARRALWDQIWARLLAQLAAEEAIPTTNASEQPGVEPFASTEAK